MNSSNNSKSVTSKDHILETESKCPPNYYLEDIKESIDVLTNEYKMLKQEVMSTRRLNLQLPNSYSYLEEAKVNVPIVKGSMFDELSSFCNEARGVWDSSETFSAFLLRECRDEWEIEALMGRCFLLL